MARESVKERLQRERAAWKPNTPKPRRSIRVMFASTVLTLEAFAVAFASLALIGLHRGEPWLWWVFGAGMALAAAMVAACSQLTKPHGYRLGWILQILALVLGFFLPPMLFVLAAFIGCWVYALARGKTLDEENLTRAQAEAEYRAKQGS